MRDSLESPKQGLSPEISTRESGCLNKAPASSNGSGRESYQEERRRAFLGIEDEPSIESQLAEKKLEIFFPGSVGQGGDLGKEGRGEAPAFESSAGDPGNTPATNRQTTTQEGNKQLVSGGLDMLSLSCYGFWRSTVWIPFAEALDKAKRQTQSGSVPGTIEGIDGEVLLVKEQGGKEGDWCCSWVLEWQGIKIMIANRSMMHETFPNLIVQIGSLTLMELGHEQAWNDCKRLLSGFGFELDRAVPGRCDPCVDLPGVTVDEFMQPFNARHRVCRAKKGGKYFDGLADTGFSIGKGIHLRVYDKLREVRNDPAKLEVLEDRRWGGQPEAATRVEFQLRGKDLRRLFSVNTVEELFAKIGSICEWLASEWFRLTDGEPDRENGHEKRANLHPIWQRVQAMFREWTAAATSPVEPRKQRCPSTRNLMQQMFGCLTTAAAVTGKSFQSVHELLDFVLQEVRSVVSEETLDDVFAKCVLWQSKGPGRGFKWSDAIPF